MERIDSDANVVSNAHADCTACTSEQKREKKSLKTRHIVTALHAVEAMPCTRAQFRQGMIDNDTQKTLVHRAVRRPDDHVPLRERVRVDRDAVDRHFGDGPVLLAHGQLFQSI